VLGMPDVNFQYVVWRFQLLCWKMGHPLQGHCSELLCHCYWGNSFVWWWPHTTLEVLIVFRNLLDFVSWCLQELSWFLRQRYLSTGWLCPEKQKWNEAVMGYLLDSESDLWCFLHTKCNSLDLHCDFLDVNSIV